MDSTPQFDERVIEINRVSKVSKGGRRFSFTALVALGDGAGRVGIGYGKAKEVPTAIQKAIESARKSMFAVPMAGTTLIHRVIGQQGASKVLLKPAAPGTGVIAGGAVRQILEAAGIRDALAKSLGAPTHLNVAKATINGLKAQRRPEEVAKARGKTPEEITPPGLLAAYRSTEMMRASGGGGRGS
ncbi:MAG: 30S ribosomal protein S5 [Acidimicrobiia bacterium]|nr:30S ribosomal protein S5 [bacterium]MXZ69842.1 30S ribosomal protein S5 [Acidimicrobiia bacterium]MYB45671.1 30S ribosomal protein S5 [Acidimicrobiia bacterium]MYC85540.1 30S ribosomal protein S5 [Acidimicrobiia bacterium]